MTGELGEQEYAIWRVVQRAGRCSVRDVFEQFGEPRGLAYTTMATVLDRLCAKGLLVREREGRSYVYAPSRKAAGVERARAQTLVSRVLGKEPEPAVAKLVDAVEAIDPELLDRLAEEIAARRGGRRGS